MMELVEINDVVKAFGRQKAVDGVSVRLEAGEVLGLLGANGAGKTTLIRMLCGLTKPDSGSIRLNGTYGYMCQSFSLIEELTIHENIRFYGSLYGLDKSTIAEREEQIVEELHLRPYFGKPVTKLPSGWRQSLSFSIAVIHRPDVLVLDEPTSGLDSLSRRRLWGMIRKYASNGTGIIVSTHYLDEAFYCDRLTMMKQGKVIGTGTPDKIAATEGGLIGFFR